MYSHVARPVCNVCIWLIQLHFNTVTFYLTGCIDWIRSTFPRDNDGRRRLLVWDSCQVNLTAAVRQALLRCEIDVAVIPGGLTPLVQLLDVSINRPFKMRVRHMWEDWMIHGEPSLTPTGHCHVLSKEVLVQWLLEVWNTIPCAMVEHRFKKCGISNKLDDTEDDVLSEDVCQGKAADDDSDTDTDLGRRCCASARCLSRQRRRQCFWRLLNGQISGMLAPCSDVETDYVDCCY